MNEEVPAKAKRGGARPGAGRKKKKFPDPPSPETMAAALVAPPPPPAPKPTGRPPREINPEELRKLCAMQCTQEEIGGWFGLSKEGLRLRVKGSPELQNSAFVGYQEGRVSIRRLAFLLAEGVPDRVVEGVLVPGRAPNLGAVIFLAKNILGMRDVYDHRVTDNRNQLGAEEEKAIDLSVLTEEELLAYLEIVKKLEDGPKVVEVASETKPAEEPPKEGEPKPEDEPPKE